MLLCRLAPGEAAVGQWTLPGGGIDFGENLLAALKREIAEETGLTLERADLWDAHDELIVRDETDYHAVRVVYHVTVAEGRPRAEEDGSTDLCGFFSPSEIGQMPHVPLVDVALSLLKRGLPASSGGV